jgi:hypothetical protein
MNNKRFDPHSPDCVINTVCNGDLTDRIILELATFNDGMVSIDQCAKRIKSIVIEQAAASINDAKSGKKDRVSLWNDAGMSKAINVIGKMK